jgi:hypothetical protein
MKQFKMYDDRADRKAKMAQKISLREKRERADQDTKYYVDEESFLVGNNRNGRMPFNSKKEK